MDTDQILDLFSLGDAGPNLITDKPKDGMEGREEDMVDVETGEVRTSGKKAWIDDLGELWDNRQYEESFDLDGFLKSMG
jgi:TATA-binding protein-associated factor